MSELSADGGVPKQPVPNKTLKATPAKRFRIETLLKSGVVGVAATFLDFFLLWLLVDGVGLDPRWANVPALCGGLAVQFFGNKLYAFEDHSRDHVRQASSFLVVEAGAFALNALSFHVLVTLTAISYLAVRLIASAAVYFFFSYPLWHWVFRPTPRTAEIGAS